MQKLSTGVQENRIPLSITLPPLEISAHIRRDWMASGTAVALLYDKILHGNGQNDSDLWVFCLDASRVSKGEVLGCGAVLQVWRREWGSNTTLTRGTSLEKAPNPISSAAEHRIPSELSAPALPWAFQLLPATPAFPGKGKISKLLSAPVSSTNLSQGQSCSGAGFSIPSFHPNPAVSTCCLPSLVILSWCQEGQRLLLLEEVQCIFYCHNASGNSGWALTVNMGTKGQWFLNTVYHLTTVFHFGLAIQAKPLESK